MLWQSEICSAEDEIMARSANNNIMLLGAIMVFGFLVLGGLFLFMNNGARAPGAGQIIVGPGSAPTQGTSAMPGQQIISCANQQPTISLAAWYNDTSNNNNITQVATTSYVCVPGSQNCFTYGTPSSGFNTTTAGQLTCQGNYNVIAGDGGATYYYGTTGAFTLNQNALVAGTGNGIQVIKAGLATAKVKNLLGTNTYSTTTSVNWTSGGYGDGGETTDVVSLIQSPSRPSVYGDLGFAICTRYNSSQYNKVQPVPPSGGSALDVTGQITHVKSTAAHDTVKCYEMGQLVSGTNSEVTLDIKAMGGQGAAQLNGSSIDMILVDKTTTRFGGQLVPAYETVDGFATDIGQADVVLNSAVTVTS